MLFGVEVSSCEETFLFFEKVKSKLEDTSMIKAPYSQKVLKCVAPGVYVFYLEPIYPNFAPYGLFLAAVPLLFGASAWFALPGLLFFLFGVAHTSVYYFLWLYGGLRRKAKYSGKIKYLSHSKLLKRACVEGWDFGSN